MLAVHSVASVGIKQGDKFAVPNGELIHVIGFVGMRVVARVNGSKLCRRSEVGEFVDSLVRAKAERLPNPIYWTALDAYWSFRNDAETERKEFRPW